MSKSKSAKKESLRCEEALSLYPLSPVGKWGIYASDSRMPTLALTFDLSTLPHRYGEFPANRPILPNFGEIKKAPSVTVPIIVNVI